MNEERRCMVCGQILNQGYCIRDGEEYYCSDDCLRGYYSEEEYNELYDCGEAYWTVWE